jgi:hypothetical protein
MTKHDILYFRNKNFKLKMYKFELVKCTKTIKSSDVIF